MEGLTIARLDGYADARLCAELMASSEPWVTLGRDFEESLWIVTDRRKETWTAWLAGEFAGFLVLNMQGAFTGYVQTVCVAHGLRGKGIGSELISFAEERIFRESPNVFLMVSSFNDEARRLYARLGYEEIGTLRDYWKSGLDEIVMRKSRGPWKGFSPASP